MPPDRYPHGARARYVAGCRCEPCTTANRLYARARAKAQRAGDWNGLVSADRARKHLRALSAKGIGRRAVAAASDLGLTTLQEIGAGRAWQIRARIERAILAVDAGARSDSSFVPAAKTWKLLDELIEEGFSKAELARRLGLKKPALQFRKDRILARTAHRVARFYRTIMLGAEAGSGRTRDRSGERSSASARLTPEARARILDARRAGVTIRECSERFQCSPTTVQKVAREQAEAVA